MRHDFQVASAMLLAFLVASCAAPPAVPTPSQTQREQVRVLAIVPAQFAPKVSVDNFASSKFSGALKGAALEGGTLAGVVGVASLAAAPIALPVAAIVGATLATAGAIHGAWAGSNLSTDQSSAVQAKTTSEIATRLQGALADRVELYVKGVKHIDVRKTDALGPTTPNELPSYAMLRDAGVDSVLEVAIVDVRFVGCEDFLNTCGRKRERVKDGLALVFTAHLRLIDLGRGRSVFGRDFRFRSPQRSVSAWLAANGEILNTDLDRGTDEVAQRMVDELFLALPIQLKIPSNTQLLYDIHSNCFYAPSFEAPGREKNHIFPELVWDAFPQNFRNGQLGPDMVDRISDVRYEVRIWETEVSDRTRLIYERKELVSPRHQVEVALDSPEPFVWSVRARFMLDGRPAATHWVQTCENDKD